MSVLNSSNGGTNTSPTASIVDVLLPSSVDEALDELANTTFTDDGVAVPVSPVDQLLMAFTRRLVTDPTLGRAAVVQLPRARNRGSLLLAITSHLLCRQPPVRFHGPVILIGLDIDVVAQLRVLSVQNRRRMGLAQGNPLSVHRLTRNGAARPVIGSATRAIDMSLVYFNTRVGSPALVCSPPLVILDATSVLSPTARARTLEWALEHGAATIVAIGDAGDDGLVQTMSDAGVVPTVLRLNEEIDEDLIDTFGRRDAPQSALSTWGLLGTKPTTVILHPVGDSELNEAIATAFRCIGSKPDGPVPYELDVPLSLLRNGTRLAARASDYRTACTYNARPGEAPLLRTLERRDFRLPDHWRHWKTSSLGSLKVAIRSLWTAIEETNPKLVELWRLLDRLHRTTSGSIAIRCHSRAAAEATRSSLTTRDRSEAQELLWDQFGERVTITTNKERYEAGAFDAQILTGAPPPWQFSHLLGVEAATTYVLVYDAEAATLRRLGAQWAATADGWQRAASRTLGASRHSAVRSPIPEATTASPHEQARSLTLPDMSMIDILDRANAALDPPETETSGAASVAVAGSSMRSCIAVKLEDGRTWWCPNEGDRATPVIVVTAAGHDHRPASDLMPGDRIVVPAGEGTESIHARLVAASRTNDDVRSLDLILSQFRTAARKVLETSGSRTAAVDRVRDAGAEHPGQLHAWANGSTIAPREPSDVAAVFVAADLPSPDLGLIYSVADALRSLNRRLGYFIAAIASGAGDDAIEPLRRIVGAVADELLDEFVVVVVDEVGEQRIVPAGMAGRVR